MCHVINVFGESELRDFFKYNCRIHEIFSLIQRHFNQVNRHSMGNKEEKEEEEENSEDQDEASKFSDDCSVASCGTTALDSLESGTPLPMNAVRLLSSPNQSNASKFSVGW